MFDAYSIGKAFQPLAEPLHTLDHPLPLPYPGVPLDWPEGYSYFTDPPLSEDVDASLLHECHKLKHPIRKASCRNLSILSTYYLVVTTVAIQAKHLTTG